MNQAALIDLAHAKMPFGKYKGYFLTDLPEYYLIWYRTKGFPAGSLGTQMASIYEIKVNGMEGLLRDIRRKFQQG